VALRSGLVTNFLHYPGPVGSKTGILKINLLSWAAAIIIFPAYY
jgi:hypothetical protein